MKHETGAERPTTYSSGPRAPPMMIWGRSGPEGGQDPARHGHEAQVQCERILQPA